MTATPAKEYKFKKFTENGTLVSANATYSFTAETNMTRVGSFEIKDMVRLKTGTGLNSGATINFIALSKDDNYFNLTSEEKFAFNKGSADWYIDGDVIPFTTDYKELKDSPGEHYLLMRASGLVMVTTITTLQGKQTFLISGTSYGGVNIDIEQPKGQSLFEQNPRKLIYYVPSTMPKEINAINIEAREKLK